MQDAFTAALDRWPAQGLPENPAAWITTVARRKLIDYARREGTRRDKEGDLLRESQRAQELDGGEEGGDTSISDDRLRLIFTCCHPALSVEAQVALTLRTLGGLATSEIARAFLIPEPTLAQRLVRAKRKIQAAKIPYEVPPRQLLPPRLGSVHSVIYLIFNEGYGATSGDSLIRRELAAEAIRLGRLLNSLLPSQPESMGLLALMLLHDSRRDARVSSQNELVPLDEQERSRWDETQIREGLQLVQDALRIGDAGPYQLQAAIAAVHSQARSPSETDWAQIAALYQELARLHPSAVVELNRAVAVAMSEGLEMGLGLVDRLGSGGELESYYLYHAARADLLRRLGRCREASLAYSRALELTANAVERRYLRRRLAEVDDGCRSDSPARQS